MTWLHLLLVPFVAYAALHVPTYCARDRAALAQTWAPRLGKGATRWTVARYALARVAARLVEVAVLTGAGHYVWLAIRASGVAQ